jgi:uncharacterized protein (TIGR03083 family)
MDGPDLATQAYPKEWTVADVLSHIGSGAVIMQRHLEDGLAGQATPDDFAPGVWGEWNAKGPRAQAQDALVADRGLLERVEELTGEDQARLRATMGPLTLDFGTFVGMRLNEHAVHTWDLEVAKRPSATLPEEVTTQVVDRLDLIVRHTGRSDGSGSSVLVLTSRPERAFRITFSPGGLELATGGGGTAANLEMPAEAFVRLVYGRLDPAHTPSVEGDPALLDKLRNAFPGP